MRRDQSPRIRGRALQRIRAAHFAAEPRCVACLAKGKLRAATDLDHRVPLFKGGPDTAQNRQGLCAECHKVKTAEDLGFRSRVRIGADGYPIDEEVGGNGGDERQATRADEG